MEQYVNGSIAEGMAKEIIDDVIKDPEIIILNGIIDLCVNGKYIEVKSCSEYVCDKTHRNNRRRGRFILTKSQHNYLVKKNGLYLFIVRIDNHRCIFKFVKARELDISFKSERTSICWKKLFI